MIKKLRAKLILASVFSLAAVLAVIIGAANLLYYQRSVSSADFLLEMLLDSGGTFPANMAEGMLALANGHLLKGIRKLTGKD